MRMGGYARCPRSDHTSTLPVTGIGNMLSRTLGCLYHRLVSLRKRLMHTGDPKTNSPSLRISPSRTWNEDDARIGDQPYSASSVWFGREQTEGGVALTMDSESLPWTGTRMQDATHYLDKAR